ncbi:MAG TPA: hypothetical protein VGV87_18960, partial [Blastocatellia bacterium]|nr:hypothetical protein [Blastocatellia bacterium]
PDALQAMKIDARNTPLIRCCLVEFDRPHISRSADSIGAFGVLSIKALVAGARHDFARIAGHRLR